MSTDPSSPSSTEPRPELFKTSEPLIIEGISYIPSSSVVSGIRKLTIKDDRAFAVLDQRAESPRIYAAELGIYYNDTRYLSIWETTFNGFAGIPLAHELRHGGSTIVTSMTNRDLPRLGTGGRIPRDTFLIRKTFALYEDTVYEIIAIRNFDTVAHSLQAEYWAGSRFDDVFEVRGFMRGKRGRLLGPKEFSVPGSDARGISLQYEGLDSRVRAIHIQRFFESGKIRSSPNLLGYFTQVEIPPKETVFLKTMISFDEIREPKLRGSDFKDLSLSEFLDFLNEAQEVPFLTGVSIETDNAIINRAIRNAKIDVNTLLTTEEGDIHYPYAGIPWFSAPFGRDGLITGYQLLPWFPKIARGVLDFVFANLGNRLESFTDEQPGKVFHEFRRGELAATREIPFIPYYGSIDSTPLALILLHEYVNWTMDLAKLKEWWPQALKALEWIGKWGDFDRDGFVEYIKQSPNGLVNQGWKDSHDSVMHEDGSLARAPIRLCEVQGYVYRARMAMADLARLLGNSDLSLQLRTEALQLKTLFHEKFWDNQRKMVYLALDGEGKPCRVLSSNMGQCLWSQIVSHEQAEDITRHLISDAMFSGHGIRTLAGTERAYNPLSYHNGSIWPHDNSLILEGLRLYDQRGALEQLSLALIGVLESSNDFRLPELYCGFRKRGDEPPVPYEVACKPQAWAAGAIFLMIKSMLGISMSMDQDYVVFNSPILSLKMDSLHIRGLSGRDWQMDIALRRATHGTYVDVTRRMGNVRVLTVK